MDTYEPVQDTNPLTDSTFHLEKTPTNKSTFPVNLNQRHSKVNQDILHTNKHQSFKKQHFVVKIN